MPSWSSADPARPGRVLRGGSVVTPGGVSDKTDRTVQSKHDTVVPWGTFSVNAIGCLILGLVIGAATAGATSSNAQLLLGTGLCGALTTYSTFS